MSVRHAFARSSEGKKITTDQAVVLFNTGSGSKYLEACQAALAV